MISSHRVDILNGESARRVTEEVKLPTECLVFYYRGSPYLAKRKQAAKNFRKYIGGRLPDHEVVGGGPIIEARDIELLIRSEVERISKKGHRMGKAIMERR